MKTNSPEVEITVASDPRGRGFDVRVDVDGVVIRWHADKATEVEPVAKDLAAAVLNQPPQQVTALVHWPASLDEIQAQLDVIYNHLHNLETSIRK